MRWRFRHSFVALVICSAAFTGRVSADEPTTQPAQSKSPDWIAVGQNAMVATDHPEASRIGMEILRGGGNAFDAAIAVSFALGVTRPYSTGLGGGGFMIARKADSGEVLVFDYRETAPKAATADMYQQAAKASPDNAPPSRVGHLAVAVPGMMAGMKGVHDELATKSWAELLVPSIKLANEGFAVDADYVQACRDAQEIIDNYPEVQFYCRYLLRRHLKNGFPRKVGDTLVQPELGKLLRSIADAGPEAFLNGNTAEMIEKEMKAHGGIITAEDITSYKPVRRQPLRSTYRGYEIITMPPPSSGGACLIEALNILETLDLASLHKDDASLAAHYEIEALKHAFADRSRWMADADFVRVPVDLLTSKPYAVRLAKGLKADTTAERKAYGTQKLPEDSGTCHYSIIDAQGNCVVATETINTHFGSLAAMNGIGLVFNNEMDDFTAQPDTGNYYRLFQSQRNAVAPHKRPLSSMTPTMVLKDGKPVLLIGGSGGPRIISSVLEVMINVLDYGETLEQAIAARRFHHQWLPNVVVFDAAPDASLAAGLRHRGHVLDTEFDTGVIQAVLIGDGKIVGASDPRKGGRPCGY